MLTPDASDRKIWLATRACDESSRGGRFGFQVLDWSGLTTLSVWDTWYGGGEVCAYLKPLVTIPLGSIILEEKSTGELVMTY